MNLQLLDFLNCHEKLAVLSGAGGSTASGIADYLRGVPGRLSRALQTDGSTDSNPRVSA